MPSRTKSPTPLQVEEQAADAIQALYMRVANGPWWDSLRSREASDVGLGPASEQALIDLISNPIYRGAVTYGADEIPHEPYRIVDDQLWYRANAALPKADTRRGNRNREAMRELSDLLDQAETIRAIVNGHHIRCRRCKRRLRWDGTTTTQGVRIPVLRCSGGCGHRTPLLVSEDLKTLKPRLRCLDCEASFLEDFHHRYDATRRKYHLKCKRCGWESWTRRRILEQIDAGPPEAPSPSPRAEPTKQARLTEPGPRPQRGPGRRRAKKPRRSGPRDTR